MLSTCCQNNHFHVEAYYLCNVYMSVLIERIQDLPTSWAFCTLVALFSRILSRAPHFANVFSEFTILKSWKQ